MIEWKDIQIDQNKTSGTAKVSCPNCIRENTRTNPKGKSLAVSIDKGLAYCHYCLKSSFRDSKKKEYKKEYKLPEQKWSNYTKLSDGMVKWFKEKRGISQKVLIENRITEEKYYQPSLKKEVSNVVFNYFEGETLINKKYRSADKKFTQSKETRNIFYNINNAIGQKELYILEGEIDVLSLNEIGIYNAISVPNGANDNDDVWINCEDFISEIEKFYIATDNDKKGDEVAEKIAQRLGRYRCERIRFKNKDANEDLIESVFTLEESLKNSEKYPVTGTYSVSSFKGGITDLYNNGLPSTLCPINNGLDKLKGKFSIMKGQLTVTTGIPSHGKSAFMEWYALNLINEYDMKLSMFSPEHSPYELHQTNFIQKFYGKPFFKDKLGIPRVTPTEIDSYINWANEKIYITCPDAKQTPDWDWLFETFTEQIYAYGIDVFMIDAFNKLILSGSGNKKDQIDNTLTRLTAFAQQHNVCILLIAHPTKMKKNDEGVYECPSLYDVSGSADFRNQTHNGNAIYRSFGEDEYTKFVNLKTKFSFQGEIGSEVYFEYDIPSGRYFPKGAVCSREPLVKLQEYPTQINFDEQTGEVEETVDYLANFEDDNFEQRESPF